MRVSVPRQGLFFIRDIHSITGITIREMGEPEKNSSVRDGIAKRGYGR